jgi:hypothetical protein
MSLREELEDLASVWESLGHGGTSLMENTLRVSARQLREALQRNPEPEPVIEWGAGFEDDGSLYNPYRTQREAESYAKSMNEVGARMIVLTRTYTPAVSTAWVPVA